MKIYKFEARAVGSLCNEIKDEIQAENIEDAQSKIRQLGYFITKIELKADEPMRIYKFEAMDATGNEIKNELQARNEEDAQAMLRGQGLFVTKITLKSSEDKATPEETSIATSGIFLLGYSFCLLMSYFVLAVPVVLLWNFAVVPTLECHELTYWQALALMPLIHILRKPIIGPLFYKDGKWNL